MVSCGISTSFPVLFPTERKVAHALLTRPPLEHLPKYLSPLDLHVLGTPPAFVLSQDQTLAFNPLSLPVSPPARLNSFGITVSCLRLLVLYRFQGSVPSRRCPARVSLCILSNFPKKVNTYFSIFLTFLQVFHFYEHTHFLHSEAFIMFRTLHHFRLNFIRN